MSNARVSLVAFLLPLLAGCGSTQTAYPGASAFTAPKPTYDGYLRGLVRFPDGAGGQVIATWTPSGGATKAVLYFHAEGEDLGTLRSTTREIATETGCAVLAVEYPGYGVASGSFSEAASRRVADAALDRLSSHYGYTSDRVVVFGRSLGAAVATDLAARRPVGGLVLVSPFSSLAKTFKAGLDPLSLSGFDPFDNLSKIGRVVCPLLVAHGDADELIPLTQGRDVFDAAVAAKDKVFVPLRGMRHNDPLSFASAAAYWDGIRHVAGTPGV